MDALVFTFPRPYRKSTVRSGPSGQIRFFVRKVQKLLPSSPVLKAITNQRSASTVIPHRPETG